jgi:hypothetical protein
MIETPSDRDRSALLRAGGYSAFAIALGYVAILPLYARVGAPPTGGGDAWMEYLAGKTATWWAIVALSVVTDVLFVPLAVALVAASARATTWIAAFGIGLFVAVDLSVTWTNYAALISLGERYASCNGPEREAVVAAAGYPAAVLASWVHVAYAIVILSAAILLASLPMARGPFGVTTTIVGVAVGLTGVAALSRASVIVIGNALLAIVWLALVGWHMLRLVRVGHPAHPPTKP